MRVIRGFLVLSALGTLVITGCGGFSSEYIPPQIILPPYIKTIAVRPFANTTSEPDVGNKLWLTTTQEFIRDGRIQYIDDENKADGVIVGTLKQFVETELSHDVNLVALEYQLWVIMDLKFLDRVNNQYLWEEPGLEQKFRYFTETAPGGMTKEDAKTELWDRFAQDIVRRTIEGFGSVMSVSPRSIPQKPIPEPPPPSLPTTNPY
ncbi:MAG: LPS assembly lipoprotein LptE [Elusimicrobia bacterium]|nr:LPS assembly lipoprotein LptE [Candidatus Obscuribacterium magneticum]